MTTHPQLIHPPSDLRSVLLGYRDLGSGQIQPEQKVRLINCCVPAAIFRSILSVRDQLTRFVSVPHTHFQELLPAHRGRYEDPQISCDAFVLPM